MARILLVQGNDDAHAATDDRLRLRRLHNPVETVHTPAEALERMSVEPSEGPDLVVIDHPHGCELAREIGGMALAVVLIDETDPGIDGVVQAPRPASLADITAALAGRGGFDFELDLVEHPGLYSPELRICVPGSSIDVRPAVDLRSSAPVPVTGPA